MNQGDNESYGRKQPFHEVSDLMRDKGNPESISHYPYQPSSFAIQVTDESADYHQVPTNHQVTGMSSSFATPKYTVQTSADHEL